MTDSPATQRKVVRTYREGYEWTGPRKQIFVYMPDHPNARSDGFVARSRLVMEELIGRPLKKEERVYHEDGDIQNDHPENLTLFDNQGQLAQHRASQYAEADEDSDDKMRLRGLTHEARKERHKHLAMQEIRRTKARRAYAKRQRVNEEPDTEGWRHWNKEWHKQDKLAKHAEECYKHGKPLEPRPADD